MRMLSLTAFALLLSACADKPEADDSGTVSGTDVDQDGYDAGEDCDDYDAAINPGATETPYNDIDEDCDGLEDDADVDGDGAAIDVDCDDTNPDVNPSAAEVCDGVDNDCDGTTDVGATDAFVAFTDADADGYGDAEATVEVCELSTGVAATGDDCNDADASINPGMQEICNDVDDNCDGNVNEGNPEQVTYYRDADGDGFGDASQTTESCETPDGYAATGDDCDDADAAKNPGATEMCDDVDWNCDGDPTAGAADAVTYYTDADGDGYGDTASGVASCTQPDGTITDGTDCNDADATANPAGVETCDGVDQNCDGAVDEGLPTATYYADADGDAYGDASMPLDACAQPDGYTADATDCDDADAITNPGAAEVCDSLDNDCDGDVDEGATDPRTWYMDADGDGFGDAAMTFADCSMPSGYVADDTDCDDDDASEYPGAAEVCDGDDDDCDGEADESDAVDASTYYADLDGDGYGDASNTAAACSAPAGYVATASPTDCDDTDASANPGGTEVCGGGDENCDGTVDEDTAADAPTWYADSDGDGYGNATDTAIACSAPAGFLADATDCDDASSAVNPGATESCDGIDDDCDGSVDESGATGETTWYLDADADGYGVTASTFAACDLPSGYAAVGDDCDDAAATTYPGATEADDGVDQDCDDYVDEDFVVVGDLIFSEVAKQPWVGTGSTNSNAYWFELYNASARTIDLSSWYFAHTAGSVTDGFYVDPADGLTVAPGEYVVFCKTDNYEGDTSSAEYPLYCDYIWGDETQASSWSSTYHDNTFNLNRDDANLQVYIEGDTSTGTLVDNVHWTYDATSGYWPRDAVRSISLDPAHLDGTDNDSLSNWCSTASSTSYRWWSSGSSYEYGTPGSGNYDCP